MKKAIMYGGGNIGRGFIAQLFCLSGWETVFVDVNTALVDDMNTRHEYPIFITGAEDYERFTVTNVRAVCGSDPDAVAEEIATADIMATAVGANILKFIAEPIARGIKRRAELGGAPLNIIVCENLMDADKYLRSLIAEKLEGDAAALDYLAHSVGIAEATIGRMVPAAPERIKALDPLAVCVEPYCELPVDSAAFVGEIPELYAIKPFAPFDFYIRRKLFMHNMSHAVLAYLAKGKGYTYIWEAAGDYELRYKALGALLEASEALSAEYGVEMGSLIDFSYELLSRFDNKLLGDTVDRVGRDTVRKLARADRLTGTVLLCMKHGIEPKFIREGMLAALDFVADGDASSAEVAAFASKAGKRAAFVKYCGLDEKDEGDRALLDYLLER